MKNVSEVNSGIQSLAHTDSNENLHPPMTTAEKVTMRLHPGPKQKKSIQEFDEDDEHMRKLKENTNFFSLSVPNTAENI